MRPRPWALAVPTVLAVLAAGAGNAAQPLRSAATGTIAFHTSISVSGDTGGPFINDIFTVKPGETRVRNLTHNGTRVHDSSPAWSPDGSRLAFVRRYDGRRDAVFSMRADGGGERRVTSYPGGRQLVALSWSPDGERIAFVRNEAIWVVNADGRSARRLIRNAGLPAWSPDGSRIAFVRRPRGGDTEIFVASADGTAPRQLTRSPDGAFNPAWSPDGRRIAFSRGDSGIFIARQDGTATRRLARGDWPFCLTWSPDGRSVAFCRSGGIALVDARGGRPRTLVRPQSVESVAWSPVS